MCVCGLSCEKWVLDKYVWFVFATWVVTTDISIHLHSAARRAWLPATKCLQQSLSALSDMGWSHHAIWRSQGGFNGSTKRSCSRETDGNRAYSCVLYQYRKSSRFLYPQNLSCFNPSATAQVRSKEAVSLPFKCAINALRVSGDW